MKKNIFRSHYFFSAVLALFFIVFSFSGNDAHAQISGDAVCGGEKVVWDASHTKIISGACTLQDLVKINKGIFTLIISIGLPLLIVFIIYRFVVAWYSLANGNANAYREALKKVTQAILGFVIIVALAGGIFLAMLKYLGVKDGSGDGFNPLKLLQQISLVPIERAYAAPYPKDACPNGTEGHRCLRADSSIGFCVGPASCQPISTSAIVTTICGGNFGTGSKCKSSSDSSEADGYCYTSRCIKSKPDPVSNDVILGDEDAGGSGTQLGDSETPTQTGDTQLPNPLFADNLYEFIIDILNTVMMFFLYPALIGVWVYAGLLYVTAQGAPEKLSKAHKLLFWAFVSTLIVFMTQAFLSAVKGSVEKILPGTVSIQYKDDNEKRA
ncbi:MAG: hypothetical protein KBC41_00200 [Candidatus Pacebacteria bacterium]|nr:hypothetical protein [Candidatus Paceibacterota bacterium]MBP9866488.1 hypothetical protein [Candidatus Paceibacterota bacterium]